MTVDDDFKNSQGQESDDNSYWRSYFESEAHAMDVHRRRSDMAGKHGFRKKYETNQRLDESQRKQKKTLDGYIFDR